MLKFTVLIKNTSSVFLCAYRVMPSPSLESCSLAGCVDLVFMPCWAKRLAGLMITGTAPEL